MIAPPTTSSGCPGASLASWREFPCRTRNTFIIDSNGLMRSVSGERRSLNVETGRCNTAIPTPMTEPQLRAGDRSISGWTCRRHLPRPTTTPGGGAVLSAFAPDTGAGARSAGAVNPSLSEQVTSLVH